MADSFSQTVKQQADIVRILGEYLKLRKSGANWNALCPFHKERSGSFYLYPGTASYYCFGCHEHGDVFSFVMKMESLSFPEAVRTVAQKMGIALPKREWNSPEEAREAGLRRQLLEVYEAATQYFQGNLQSPEAARAREYMSNRGITAEASKTFRLGYAPESYTDMLQRLSKFFPEDVLRASGLFKTKDGDDNPAASQYARFRKRLMFPICNEAGKPIAFTGRLLDTADEKAGAKYLNSPETQLYTKGHVLFNLDKAKSAVREQDVALLVEGQMDCLSVYMGGLHGVLATSGTAFTEHQVRLLGRFTKKAVLNFDGDKAGLDAAVKTLAPLVEDGFEVRVVTLPNGADPDSFLREHGIAEYTKIVRGAVPWTDFLIDRARETYGTRTPDERVRSLNYLLPHLRRIPNTIVRTQVAENAAQKLGIESSMVLKEIRQAAEHRLESVRAAEPQAVTEVERILLCALVLPEADSARRLAADSLGAHPEWFEDLATSAVIEVLVSAPAPENPLSAAPDPASRALLASALHVSTEVSGSEHEMSPLQVASALESLRGRYLERRAREVRSQISEAQRRGDTPMLMQLMQQKLQLERERVQVERGPSFA